MGEKTEQKIIAGIASCAGAPTGRQRVGDVLPVAQRLLESLRAVRGVQKIEYAGSLRRGRETIGDMDFVAATHEPAALMEAFRALPLVAEVLLSGETKTSVILQNGMQVDLRTVEPARLGHGVAILHRQPGSQHPRARGGAKEGAVAERICLHAHQRWRRNHLRYGGGVYAQLGMAYVPPEMREDRGEIEAAQKDTLRV